MLLDGARDLVLIFSILSLGPSLPEAKFKNFVKNCKKKHDGASDVVKKLLCDAKVCSKAQTTTIDG